MNFEDIKSEWDNEDDRELNIPLKMDKLRQSHMPIDLLKKMMKKELLAQSAAIVFLAILPFIIPSSLLMNLKLYYLVFFVLLNISALFMLKFYKFYHYLNDISTNTKDNLYEIYYEIKINLEAYKTWSYTLTPVIVIMLYQILFNKETVSKLHIQHDLGDNIYLIGAIIFISSVYMYFATNWWIDKYYGPHLIKIKNILNDLKES